MKIIVISGPSRSGKDAILSEILKKMKNIQKVTTATTRKKRKSEIESKDYYFLNKKEFNEKIKKDFFLEYAIYQNEYYGTPKKEIKKILKDGKLPILKIEVQGFLQLKQKYKNKVIGIFIYPDNLKTILKRMKKAGFSKKEINERFSILIKELALVRFYDFVIENKTGYLNKSVEKLYEILKFIC